MDDLASLQPSTGPKRLATYGAAAVLALGLGGYAMHEHSAAKELAAQNAQQNATLTATQHQLSDLATRVNELAAVNAAQASLAPPSAQAPTRSAAPTKTAKPRARVDSRYKKLQAQLDAQGKAIDQNRKDLEGSIASTRTELNGSIAHTHDELVLLEKKEIGRAHV